MLLLQEVMSVGKNYFIYREELAKLVPFLYKYEDNLG